MWNSKRTFWIDLKQIFLLYRSQNKTRHSLAVCALRAYKQSLINIISPFLTMNSIYYCKWTNAITFVATNNANSNKKLADITANHTGCESEKLIFFCKIIGKNCEKFTGNTHICIWILSNKFSRNKLKSFNFIKVEWLHVRSYQIFVR